MRPFRSKETFSQGCEVYEKEEKSEKDKTMGVH